MARPRKITPDYLAPYFAAVALGSTQHHAAAASRVTEQTIRNARRCLWFVEAEKKALADAVTRRIERIESAGTGGFVLSRKTTYNHKTDTEVVEESFARPEWQADAWVLERRYPDDFGKRDRLEINIRSEAERIAKERGLDVDEVQAEADRIIKGVKA